MDRSSKENTDVDVRQIFCLLCSFAYYDVVWHNVVIDSDLDLVLLEVTQVYIAPYGRNFRGAGHV